MIGVVIMAEGFKHSLLTKTWFIPWCQPLALP